MNIKYNKPKLFSDISKKYDMISLFSEINIIMEYLISKYLT